MLINQGLGVKDGERGQLLFKTGLNFARWKSSGDLFQNIMNILNTTELYTSKWLNGTFYVVFLPQEKNALKINSALLDKKSKFRNLIKT